MMVNEKKDKWTIVRDFAREYGYIPVVIIVVYLLVGVIFQISFVPSGSMEPTYMTGSFIVGNRLADMDELERGAVIVFEKDGTDYVKRVVGLPGDTVSFSDGHVYINGALLDESDYLSDDVRTFCDDMFCVPDGCYFPLGDNRENSLDARFWADPYVPSDAISSVTMFALHNS